MKTLNVLTNLARAVGVALLLQVPAQAQTEWRFNNSYPASRPESAQIRTFAADVEKRTGGKLKISISEGGALGLKDADAMRFDYPLIYVALKRNGHALFGKSG